MGRHGAVGEEPGRVERHDGPAPAPCSQVVPSGGEVRPVGVGADVEFGGQDG